MKNYLKRKAVILSIDGGGIRGIIPALTLLKIKRHLQKEKRNKPFHELFDLFAGTSTGALIALGLSVPKDRPERKKTQSIEPILDIENIIDLYRNKGNFIFPLRKNPFVNKSIQAVKCKYNDVNLFSLLTEIFSDAKLSDVRSNIIISSYDIERREPKFFSSFDLKKENEQDFFIKDIARATTAAPTYFQPARIKPINDDFNYYPLIDGGVFVNNPSLVAYYEARKIFPDAKQIRILSLGTGVVDRPYRYEEVRNWGYIEWVAPHKGLPLLSMMMDGQSDCAVGILNRMPGVEHIRLDVRISEKNSFMDDTSKPNIKYLEEKAEQLYEENRQNFLDLYDWF